MWECVEILGSDLTATSDTNIHPECLLSQERGWRMDPLGSKARDDVKQIKANVNRGISEILGTHIYLKMIYFC